MAKKVFTNEEKKRMGILWVLLNWTTEYKGDAAKISDGNDREGLSRSAANVESRIQTRGW